MCFATQTRVDCRETPNSGIWLRADLVLSKAYSASPTDNKGADYRICDKEIVWL